MKRRRWAWLVLATLGLLLGIYHNHVVQRGGANPLTALVRSLIIPLQRGAQHATDRASEFAAMLIRAREALRAYDHLALENARLRQEVEQLRALAAENEALRQLLDLRARLPHQWLGCRVIAAYPQPAQQTLIIDRGTRDGVIAGAPVVAGAGLLGVVAWADRDRAIVRLLSAPRMAVSAKVLNPQKVSLGVCEGRGESRLLLNFVPPEAPVQVGDQVVSAGLGSKYPPDIPIGTVEAVWLDRQFSVKKAWVRPAVNFEQVRVVLVQRAHSPAHSK